MSADDRYDALFAPPTEAESRRRVETSLSTVIFSGDDNGDSDDGDDDHLLLSDAEALATLEECEALDQQLDSLGGVLDAILAEGVGLEHRVRSLLHTVRSDDEVADGGVESVEGVLGGLDEAGDAMRGLQERFSSVLQDAVATNGRFAILDAIAAELAEAEGGESEDADGKLRDRGEAAAAESAEAAEAE